MASLSVRVPDRLASRFEAFAAARGGKSKVLRALMESAVQDAAPLPADEPSAGPGRSSKVTLRLKEADLAPLDVACADAGLKRTEWLVALARRRLHSRPQFDRASAEALLETRRELRRLGVQLRDLADTERGGEEVSSATLEAMRVEVRGHLERVRQAIAGNLAYWDAG